MIFLLLLVIIFSIVIFFTEYLSIWLFGAIVLCSLICIGIILSQKIHKHVKINQPLKKTSCFFSGIFYHLNGLPFFHHEELVLYFTTKYLYIKNEIITIKIPLEEIEAISIIKAQKIKFKNFKNHNAKNIAAVYKAQYKSDFSLPGSNEQLLVIYLPLAIAIQHNMTSLVMLSGYFDKKQLSQLFNSPVLAKTIKKI